MLGSIPDVASAACSFDSWPPFYDKTYSVYLFWFSVIWGIISFFCSYS